MVVCMILPARDLFIDNSCLRRIWFAQPAFRRSALLVLLTRANSRSSSHRQGCRCNEGFEVLVLSMPPSSLAPASCQHSPPLDFPVIQQWTGGATPSKTLASQCCLPIALLALTPPFASLVARDSALLVALGNASLGFLRLSF